MDENAGSGLVTKMQESGQSEGCLEGMRDPLQEELQRIKRKCKVLQAKTIRQNAILRSTQKELQQVSQRYSDIYDFSSLGYLKLNNRGIIIDANLSSVEMLGIEKEHLIGKSFSEFIVADDQDIFYRRQKTHAAIGAKKAFELRLKKEGKYIFHAQAEIAVTGTIHSGEYWLQLIDTTIQKKDEIAHLEKIKDKYRGIVMDQNDLICRLDSEGKITFVNDAYCRFFSLHHNDVLQTFFHSQVHEEHRALFNNHLKKLTVKNPNKCIEYRTNVDGRNFHWLQWHCRALFDQTGQIVEYQIVGRDITEFKKTQTDLQTELQLRQRLLDSLPGIVLLIHYPTRRIIASNKMAKERGAYARKFCFKSLYDTPTYCAECPAPKVMKTQENLNQQHWQNGRYWDLYWVPVNEESYLQYGFDITEQQMNKEALLREHHNLIEDIRKSTTELKDSRAKLLHFEKLAAVGNISAAITHEFNNPLQSVMTILQGIQQSASLQKMEMKMLDLAIDECVRMKNLVSDFRDFYRPDLTVPVDFNPQETIDVLLQFIEKDYMSRLIRIRRQYTDASLQIRGIPDQLKQVLINMIKNSADACQQGGEIIIKTEISGKEAVIHVEDNGKGIDAADLPHIFEPFYTTKAELGGSGLGLSICRDIIQGHGGHINVSSEPSKKTRFSIFLPLSAHDDKQENTPG